MKHIGLLSDTHGILPKQVYDFFKDCDLILHAGDIGGMDENRAPIMVKSFNICVESQRDVP